MQALNANHLPMETKDTNASSQWFQQVQCFFKSKRHHFLTGSPSSFYYFHIYLRSSQNLVRDWQHQVSHSLVTSFRAALK